MISILGVFVLFVVAINSFEVPGPVDGLCSTESSAVYRRDKLPLTMTYRDADLFLGVIKSFCFNSIKDLYNATFDIEAWAVGAIDSTYAEIDKEHLRAFRIKPLNGIVRILNKFIATSSNSFLYTVIGDKNLYWVNRWNGDYRILNKENDEECYVLAVETFNNAFDKWE